MTVLCGGGTSAAKSGFDQVVIGAGLITAGLGTISPWLLPVAVLIDAFVYDAGTQCASDPPPLPSSADLAITNVIPGGILNPNFQTWVTAAKNLLLNWAWTQYCQCTSGTVPTINYPPPPSTVTTVTPSGSLPCFSGHWSGLVSAQNTSGDPSDWQSIMSMFPPGWPTGPVITGLHHPMPTLQLPTGASEMSWTMQYSCTTGGSCSDAGIDFYDNANHQVGTTDFRLSITTNPGSGQRIIPAGATCFAMQAVCDGFTSGFTPQPLSLDFTFRCGTGGTGLPQECCPPDETSLQLLQNIYGLLQSIYQGQSLLLPPHSYASGTVHSGLSGNGTITLVGSPIAVRVDITTDTPFGGSEPGDPTYLARRGFIVPIISQGPVRADVQLAYNPQVYLLPRLTEQIGYGLTPGVIISITELTPGP